jgi:acyl carrier protein
MNLDINTMPGIGMPSAGLARQVKALLSDELGLPPDIEDSEGIFSGGYLQSIDVVTIILLLREKFAVVVRPDEVSLGNFDSIALISNFIERERNRPAADATIH